jgi:hypothetical protein
MKEFKLFFGANYYSSVAIYSSAPKYRPLRIQKYVEFITHLHIWLSSWTGYQSVPVHWVQQETEKHRNRLLSMLRARDPCILSAKRHIGGIHSAQGGRPENLQSCNAVAEMSRKGLTPRYRRKLPAKYGKLQSRSHVMWFQWSVMTTHNILPFISGCLLKLLSYCSVFFIKRLKTIEKPWQCIIFYTTPLMMIPVFWDMAHCRSVCSR